MVRQNRYSDRSRELAEDLRVIARGKLKRTEQAIEMGLTRDEVFDMGLLLAQCGVTPDTALPVIRLGRIAQMRGVKERDLLRVNKEE